MWAYEDLQNLKSQLIRMAIRATDPIKEMIYRAERKDTEPDHAEGYLSILPFPLPSLSLLSLHRFLDYQLLELGVNWGVIQLLPLKEIVREIQFTQATFCLVHLFPTSLPIMVSELF